ncbi:MAG: urease accessory protein UreD [Hyphomicrobiaceae bacterium]
MSGATSPSDPEERALSEALAPVRVSGGVHARFMSDGTRTAIASVAERGGYRLARPTTFGSHLEALQINTGGGVAGGDRIETVYELGSATDVVHTTSSAERIYRSDGASSRLDVRVALEPGGRLDWLPQQTILYAGARLERSIEVDVAADARLLMVEVTTFGRPESQEGLSPASLNDQWRVRRDGQLVYAEAVRLSGELAATLDRPAIAGGARAAALVLLIAPDASDLVEPLRCAIECDGCETGVTAWNGLLAARALAKAPGDLLAALARAIPILSGRAVPRVWAT